MARPMIVLGGPAAANPWLARTLSSSFSVRLEPIPAAVLQSVEDDENTIVVLDARDSRNGDTLGLLRRLQPEAAYRVAVAVAASSGTHAWVRALIQVGIADFFRLPIARDELLLRIEAVVRRNSAIREVATARGVFGGPAPIPGSLGTAQPLTKRERLLFTALAEDFGRPIARVELRRRIWGEHASRQSNILDVYVCYLRRKLEQGRAGLTVQTYPGAYALTSAAQRTKKPVSAINSTVDPEQP